MRTILIPSLVVLVAVAGCTTGSSDPDTATSGQATTVTSCGLALTIDQAPERAVTLEQGATELLLALGVGDSMVGTAYLSDPVASEYADAYEQIPVLADLYPTAEQLREVEPDFVYSMRASAFSADAVGERTELAELGVPAYLSSNDCEDADLIADEVGFDQIFAEITDLATIFDVQERGEELIAEQQAVLDQVTGSAQDRADLDVIWLYSTYNGAPIVAGSTGLAQTMTELVGASNAFADLDAQWAETSWDQIAQRDPDVIVLADLTRGRDGDSAADKIEILKSDSVTAQLSAVQGDRMITIPGIEMDPSVRSINALRTLSDSLAPYAQAAQ